MYRYYFSNKHLPILFFFFLTPLFVVTKINVLSTINHLGNEISNVEYRKKSQANKKSPSRKLSNTKRNKKGITSCTQFDPVFEYDKYSVLFYSKKKKTASKKRNLSSKKKERSSIDPLEPLTNEPLSQSTTLLACFRSSLI